MTARNHLAHDCDTSGFTGRGLTGRDLTGCDVHKLPRPAS